ncbi:unconventional myosin-XIX-like [Pocillopora damicornis]|uniref:unconventional myosin-XIX-like n=1 Tax=Pocillopora damicornis TaxID=46731 RepID=UPI000F553996|nr:unconventional myosin-XIX-like [Pocillopora damicornis]
MKVLENLTANKPAERKKDGSFEESFHKRNKEENLAFQSIIDDLTSLSPLNEKTVLQVIEARFQTGKFYSWAGVPLIAVNPFQNVADLYDSATVEKYKRIGPSEIKECPPHIFAIGQKVYCDLRRDMETKNQSVIVSGESGAGKTWTTRKLMHFITDLTNSRKDEIAKVNRIEQRILDSNPILEAFGNAKTVRNENSSRFGKYIQLQFDRNQKIVGATINTYLLEKTRVVHQAKGERKFHIFDQMTSAECHLQDSSLRNDESASAALEATKQALENVGIDHQLQCEIFKILSGILKLCDVHFADGNTTTTSEICYVQDNKVSEVCDLLGTEAQSLEQCLCSRRITTGSTGEQFMKPCSTSECVERRDCIAKLVYSRLFDWIVNFINISIRAPPDSKHSFIGLLDIYGFENFHLNSLEQLCINYANEKLQQHFVYHFMKRQQEEYQKEGIDWTFQEFVDNRPCLDLIEGRTSVFSLMNEECRLKRELDTNSFSTRLKTALAQNTHFTCPRFKSENHEFSIHHFAESVSYQVEGLVKKNKDFVPPEVIELLQSSTNSLIQELFQARDLIPDRAGEQENGQFPFKESSKHRQSTITVVHKFKDSLNRLMSTLRSTNVHYIRCIKPNSNCQPGVFDRNQRLEQVRNRCLTKSVLIIQKCWRRHKRRLERRRVTAAVLIQSAWKGWRAKINFRRIQESTKVIQRYARRYFEAKRLKKECRSVLNSTGDMSTKEALALKERISVSPLSPSFSLLETTSRHFGLTSSLASRAMLSWFDEFTPQNHRLSPCKSQMIMNSSRSHVSPLGLLMGFGRENLHTRIQTSKHCATQSVNKSSTIISRRDIEKVPVAFHCKGTPLAYANTRPHPGNTTNTGLASISEMDC